MKGLLPWAAALLTLILLWPAVCVSSEDGPTSCQSLALVPLPWGESADTWGFVAALVGAVVAFVAVRLLVSRHDSRD